MAENTNTITEPVSNSMMEKVREHHRRRPILMVFIMAIALVAISAGSLYAYIALTQDRAVFNSNLNNSNPVRQHILRVDGAGDLIATLTDKTQDNVNKVRYNLTMLDAEGNLLQNVKSTSRGQKIQIKNQVVPGDYTFIVKSEDELTETGASYTLRIDYPNDVANFEDKIAPTLTINSPELGAEVKGIFTIGGVASDETELAQIAVKLENEDAWLLAEGTNNWQLQINSENYSNGQRVITVQATDSSGNTVSEQTLVNFNNDLTMPNPTPDPTPNPTPDPTPTPTPDNGSTTPGAEVQGASFSVDFASNSGLDKFLRGVYHRGVGKQTIGQAAEIWGDGNAQKGHGGSWTGDHDLSCGAPETQRQLSSSSADFNVDEIVYVCRDHLMTSMGDVDGYSIVWFAPNAQFTRSGQRTISWDVNVTDLKARQWWEVSVVPANGPFLATVDWLAGTANIDSYDKSSVVVGNGPFGNTVNITTNGENQYDGWQGVCGQWGLDPEACKSKMIRRTFSITDNNNGTLTVNYGGMFTQTVPGKLPDNYKVYFKDHNYTPDKDGMPVGHTWHWDNISIR